MYKRMLPRLERFYRWLNRHSGGIPEVIGQAVQRFNRVRGAEAAASIAYYAIFSLFPLLLFLTAVFGYMIVNAKDPTAIVTYILGALPISRTFIRDNLLTILNKRSTGGLVGLIGLVWAASGVFISLARNINRAWPGAESRNFVQGRLVALLMIAILTFLLIAGFIAITVVSLIPVSNPPVQANSSPDSIFLWTSITRLVSWSIAFLVFFGMYRWIPNTRVRKREAFWGALIATAAWELLTWAFTLYLSSSLVQYEIVYGSLGAALALLTWIYLSAIIILFGAHLSASVARLVRHPETSVPAEEKQT